MIDDIDDMEWQRQERARQAERLGIDAEDSDALTRSYRRVARELAQDLDVPLPSNFVYSNSTRIEALAGRRRNEQARFERSAFACLAAVSATGVIITLAIYGGEWWSVLESVGWMQSPSAAWIIALAGCGLLSRLLNRATH
ncbi:MAG: hypothetical protein ABIW30_02725 [Arenimonas sp.]